MEGMKRGEKEGRRGEREAKEGKKECRIKVALPC